MKTRILGVTIGSLALAVIGLLIQTGRMQGRQAENADSPTPESLTTYADEVSDTPDAGTATNTTAQPLATNALPSLLSQPTTPTGVKLSRGAHEIARFAQGGIGEDVMLSYIANANGKFNLGSDQIVYLNDIGVSGNVMKAMMQRDAALDAQARAYAASQAAQPGPPVFTNFPPGVDETSYPQPPPDDTAMTPPDDASAPLPTDDSQYYYNSLAPFGSWIYVAGCGVCWQPTVCVANRGWRPYCNRGRWVYSNCGWYWQSDYSWGWAAFHYGRWYEHPRCGWVWCPGKVWSPAWVSWRASGEYCGWAPLPPSAKYVAGGGFTYGNRRVAAGFEFGLQAHQYTFVPIARLSDYAPARYAAASWDAERINAQTKVITEVKERNHRVIAAGVDPKQVATLARTQIRTVEIRDTPRALAGNEQGDRMTRSGGNLVIDRPQLPAASSRVAVHAGETYPPGSLVLRGNGQASRISSASSAFVANTSLPLQPTYTERQFTPTYSGYSAQALGNQRVSTHVITGHFTAARSAGGVSSGAASPYRVYSTPSPWAAREEQPAAQPPHVLPGHFTAAERVNTSSVWAHPSMESASPLRSHNESFSSPETHTHTESHSYSAPAHGSYSSSSSSSHSSGSSSSNHK